MMDQQKTGILIAARRRELGMTQRALAEKLGISDRAVSKWERGAGFPDVSLIEPLADALELTVLELFHGEVQTPAPEQERSAREVLDICRPQIEAHNNRTRRWMTAFGILSILAFALLTWLTISAQGRWINSRLISAEKAVKITPAILISTADYELLDTILADEKVSEAYDTYFPESLYMEGDAVSQYREMVDIDGEEPLFFDILVRKDSITVKYGTRHIFISLVCYKEEVSKHVILHEYPYLTESGENIPLGQRHGKRIDLDNTDNIRFSTGGYKTGWLELFRTTYY